MFRWTRITAQPRGRFASSWMIALAARGARRVRRLRQSSQPPSNPPAPTQRHGYVAGQHHGCGRRLRQLFRRRAVRHLGAARRRDRRGIAGDDAYRLRAADRSLGSVGRRHSGARRHRRRQDPPRLRQCRSVRRVRRPSRPRERRRRERRTARRHRARHRARCSQSLGHHARPRGIARRSTSISRLHTTSTSPDRRRSSPHAPTSSPRSSPSPRKSFGCAAPSSRPMSRPARTPSTFARGSVPTALMVESRCTRRRRPRSKSTACPPPAPAASRRLPRSPPAP